MPSRRKATEDLDTFTRVERILGEVKQELVAAHAAVEEASEGLQRAEQRLSEIVDKCYALVAPGGQESPSASSSVSALPNHVDSSGRSIISASARLNARVASLEGNTDNIESENQDYAAFFAKISAFPSLFSKLPGLVEFRRSVEEEREQGLENLVIVREQLDVATRTIQNFENVYVEKVTAYRKLEASWNGARRLRQWESGDIDEDVELR